jgi:hypothetical protein
VDRRGDLVAVVPNPFTGAMGLGPGLASDGRGGMVRVSAATRSFAQEPWDLGHIDGSGKTLDSGPEHRRCNRATVHTSAGADRDSRNRRHAQRPLQKRRRRGRRTVESEEVVKCGSANKADVTDSTSAAITS